MQLWNDQREQEKVTEKGKFGPHAFPISDRSPSRDLGCLLALAGQYKPMSRAGKNTSSGKKPWLWMPLFSLLQMEASSSRITSLKCILKSWGKFDCAIFTWNAALASLIFLKRSLVLPILLFVSISLHKLLGKAFLSLLAILWNSEFRWIYIYIYPLPFTSLLFSDICKASQTNNLPFCISSCGWFWSPHLYNVTNLCP